MEANAEVVNTQEADVETEAEPETTPYGTRIHELALASPDEVALIFAAEDRTERHFTWAELDDRTTQVARALARRGLGVGDLFAMQLKNSPELVFATFAAWKLGAVPVPVRWDLPEWELGRLRTVINAALVVDASNFDLFEDSLSESTEVLPEVTAPHHSGICSSGSTGSPKVILRKSPAVVTEGAPGALGIMESWGPISADQLILTPGPIYHNNGFLTMSNLLSGYRAVLMERFRADHMVDLIERHRVTGFTGATPMFQRVAQLPDIASRDFSSIEWTMQGAAVLPQWLARFWFDLIGPERFYMTYGSSEGAGVVACRGDGWLEHPGTLGQPWTETEIRILGPEGDELPAGEIGEIYLRQADGITHGYLGDVPPAPVTDDNFTTIGDLGWLDEEGWLYMADRRVDMIVSGGANVFPAEVEAALSEHPGLADVVVIGLPDEEWGQRVHAIAQWSGSGTAVTEREVIEFAKSRLSPYKVPKSVEFVDLIPRSEATKVNRSALVAERVPAAG
ncbi:MAG: bile acid-coenzyme ligase [Acidimicrobiaceae bacterium]|nr:bile acid-coenzyme ligase [Acidimicrobiaceae bacterium]